MVKKKILFFVFLLRFIFSEDFLFLLYFCVPENPWILCSVFGSISMIWHVQFFSSFPSLHKDSCPLICPVVFLQKRIKFWESCSSDVKWFLLIFDGVFIDYYQEEKKNYHNSKENVLKIWFLCVVQVGF